MAQYQHNFYGTSYYGETNAFSGTYETQEILTDKALKDTYDVTVTAVLPTASYIFGKWEVTETAGTWNSDTSAFYRVTNSPSAQLLFRITCDQLTINYRKQTGGPTLAIQVATKQPGSADVITNYSLDTSGSGEGAYSITGLAYGMQEVTITVPSTNTTGEFWFKNVTARVTDIKVETRAADGTGTWTSYTSVPITITAIAGKANTYEIKATSPNYTGCNKVQVRLWLATSDNNTSPVVQSILTYAGNTDNRNPEGTWTAVLDMQTVATNAGGKTFSEVTDITWTSSGQGSIVMTTRSSPDTAQAFNWSGRSVPYKKNVKRLRLKHGFNTGYMETPFINPIPLNTVTITSWDSWEDQSYLPPNSSNTEQVNYYFQNERKEVLYRINQPMWKSSRTLTGASNGRYELGRKSFQLKVELIRQGYGKCSPVVDFVIFHSSLRYEERKVIEKKVSTVDNQNTGKSIILNMSDLTYTPPQEVPVPIFDIIEYSAKSTNAPIYDVQTQSVLVYFDSEKDTTTLKLGRTNTTTLRSDKIWAEVKSKMPYDNGKIGVIKHYQYGGGTILYPNKDNTPMSSSFTPAQDNTRQYRYYLDNGWLDANTNVYADNSRNTDMLLYWDTQKALAASNRTNLTDKSALNARLNHISDVSSDIIMAEVTAKSTIGTIPWVSEEKIYTGICNINNLQTPYKRKHTLPASDDFQDKSYTVLDGETYESISAKFDTLYADDIRLANEALMGSQPKAGQVLIIPSPIVLPKVDAKALLHDNAYTVEIIYNSVKQNGEIVEDSRINSMDLQLLETEVTVTNEEIIRGDTPNGKDLLNNPKVTQVLLVKEDPNDPAQVTQYIQYDPQNPAMGGDFILDGSYIDWSPTSALSIEPTPGTKYYVTYKCMHPTGVDLTIGSNYQEENGVDRIWRSPEMKEFSGTCSPGIDFTGELPPTSEWKDADPDTLAQNKVENVEYLVEDNDLWVKTSIAYDDVKKKYVVIGSLQNRIPKDNWLPTIKTGYYYLGKDEYYLYSDPITFTPQQRDMPKSKNITYGPGKFANAAFFERASTNLIRNSGFDVASTEATIYKDDFYV